MAAPNKCYNLRYLGCAPISKFTPGLGALQKPLHDLYVTYLTPKGPKLPVLCRVALTDRGIILTANGNDSFYSMRDILLWEAVLWVFVQTKDKKIMSAFEPVNPDHHRSKEGLFSKLDGQFKYLSKMPHDPLLAFVLRKTSGSKVTIEVHSFLCGSEGQAADLVESLWRAEQMFQGQEANGLGGAGASHAARVVQEAPKSVRGSSAGSQLSVAPPASVAADPRGKKSARQAKGRRGEGEITLDELIRLADRALAEPTENAAAQAPGFKMGESWAAKEQKGHGVQRSRTFNDGPVRKDPAAESRGRSQEPHGASNPPLNVPFYENVVVQNPGGFGQPPTHLGNNNNHLQQPDSRGNAPQGDPKRRSMPPESLRMVIAESRASEANKRASVLPESGLSVSAFNLSVPAENPRTIVEVYTDHDEAHPANPSPKPVALVQPRKVPRYKVLPEATPDGFQLQKAPQASSKGQSDEPRREQYQAGAGGNGRNFTRSMGDLNNIAQKPTTPLVSRKDTNQDSDARKVANSEMDVARKQTNVHELERKMSNPEAGKDQRQGEKAKPEKEKKESELEAFAKNINFNQQPANTMSAHATNFENALGYFP